MFMKRRAYVEFVECSKCVITNQYQTKEFDLNERLGKYIDLPSLKVSDGPTAFCAEILYSECHILSVFVKTSKDNKWEPMGHVSLEENKKNFRANVWEE